MRAPPAAPPVDGMRLQTAALGSLRMADGGFFGEYEGEAGAQHFAMRRGACRGGLAGLGELLWSELGLVWTAG